MPDVAEQGHIGMKFKQLFSRSMAGRETRLANLYVNRCMTHDFTSNPSIDELIWIVVR